MTEISKITAREVLDSRGNPTVEAEVMLSDGSSASASVPSGASTGKFEAFELRDTDDSRYHRMGVRGAVSCVNSIIAPALVGMDAFDISEADSVMITLDGVYNKSKLGANAILSVSLALARAAAVSLGVPLYRYLGGALAKRMPVPMMNILNGGKHSDNNIDIQEFMIIPIGADSFSTAVAMSSEIYHTLKNILSSEGLSVAVGDEGGFAPELPSCEAAIELILRAVRESGYKDGADVLIGLDAASSEWYFEGKYILPKSGKRYTPDELVSYFASLCEKYPILSIEDGVGEEDIYGWQRLTERLSHKGIMLVGDDLFVTNAKRVKDGKARGIANALLVKPNQVGTLSEAADAVFFAQRHGYKTVMSHRSGDTEDTFIADLSVALSCEFIKTGAPARAERTAKYNRLLKIESELFSPEYAD